MNRGQAGKVFDDGRQHARWALAFVAVLGLAAGCGSTSFPKTATTTTSPPTRLTSPLPAGYVSFADQKDRFTVAVPRAWRRIDPSSPGASQALGNVLAANPGMKSVIGSNAADLITKGTKFLAVNVNVRVDTPTVNVVVEPAVGARESDLPQVVDALKRQYAKAGATIESTRIVPLTGHRALEVLVTVRLTRLTGGAVLRKTIQDFVVANDLLYIVTLEGTSADLRTILSTFNVS